MVSGIQQLRIQLRKAQYCRRLEHSDFSAVAALLETLRRVSHSDLSAHLAAGKTLEERLLLVRQWAIAHQKNRLRMNVEAVMNVVDAYRLGARV